MIDLRFVVKDNRVFVINVGDTVKLAGNQFVPHETVGVAAGPLEAQ